MRTTITLSAIFFSFLALAACGSSGTVAPPFVEPGPQSATIQVDLNTLAVTVTAQPTNLLLTPQGAATWPGAGQTLTFDLAIQNNFGRILFNLKPTVASTTDAGALPMGDGMYDGKPFFYWGHQGLDLSASRTKTLTLDNVTGPSMITIEFSIHNHWMFFGVDDYALTTLYAVDGSGTDIDTPIDISGLGNSGYGKTFEMPDPGSGYSNVYNGVVTSDARFAYWGCRNQPGIVCLDTTTMVPFIAVDLTGANNIKQDRSGTGSIGFCRGICMSPDEQFLYAVLTKGGQMFECNSRYQEALGVSLELVRVRRSDMAIVDRAVVLSNVDEVMGTRPSMSADGRYVCFNTKTESDDDKGNPPATVRGKIFVVDTLLMSFVTHDVRATQPFVSMSCISPDASQIYFTDREDDTNSLHCYNRASGMITTIPSSAPKVDDAFLQDMKFIGGRLYTNAKDDGFHVFDPGAGTYTRLIPGSSDLAGPIMVKPGGASVLIQTDKGGTVWHLQIPSGTPIPAPADGMAPITASECDDCHAFLATPF